jgi:hypothetical protein
MDRIALNADTAAAIATTISNTFDAVAKGDAAVAIASARDFGEQLNALFVDCQADTPAELATRETLAMCLHNLKLHASSGVLDGATTELAITLVDCVTGPAAQTLHGALLALHSARRTHRARLAA